MIRRSCLVLLLLVISSFSFSQSKKQSKQPKAAEPSVPAKQAAAKVDEKLFGAMRWRQVGPFRGGRVLAVTGVPSEPNVFYFE